MTQVPALLLDRSAATSPLDPSHRGPVDTDLPRDLLLWRIRVSIMSADLSAALSFGAHFAILPRFRLVKAAF
jgi:hypothetical protein